MARLNASDATAKWQRRIKAATEDMRKGVEGVTESPMKRAAAKQDKMRASILSSIDSGKWAAGLNRVSLEEWRKNMTEKGIARVASGADGAKEKMESFMSDLLPHVDSGKNKVDKMPDVTLEDSIQKMRTWVEHMASFKRSK